MRRRRWLLIIVLLAFVAALLIGGRVAYGANERVETARAFSVLRTVDRRIDLQGELPGATRSESGVAVRLGGSGDGPSITYSFTEADFPNWERRYRTSMLRAGYGNGEEPSVLHVQGYVVTILTSMPETPGGLVYISISTL